MKILVIDDDPYMRELLAGILSKFAEVVTAPDGESGVEAFSALQADGECHVFTDFQLPGMDGDEVVRKIKRISPQTSVVFMTGNDTPGMEEIASGAGADVFWYKPILFDELEKGAIKALRDIEKSEMN